MFNIKDLLVGESITHHWNEHIILDIDQWGRIDLLDTKGIKSFANIINVPTLYREITSLLCKRDVHYETSLVNGANSGTPIPIKGDHILFAVQNKCYRFVQNLPHEPDMCWLFDIEKQETFCDKSPCVHKTGLYFISSRPIKFKK